MTHSEKNFDHECPYSRELKRAMDDGFPSTGDDLQGMTIDVDHYLSELDEIRSDSVVAKLHEGAPLLISADCEVREGISLDAAVAAVSKTWSEDIAYAYAEASCASIASESAEFFFVTQVLEQNFYVNGRVRIFLPRH